MGDPLSIENLLYSGKFNEIIESTVDFSDTGARAEDLSRDRWDLNDLPFIVGALSFVGRLQDGENLYLSKLNQLESRQKTVAGFFLGIGFCRTSDFSKAKDYIFAPFLKTVTTQRELFYRYQGQAIYKFYRQQNRSAVALAGKALLLATGDSFIFGRVIAADLAAHSWTRLGQPLRGLKLFAQAKQLAQKIDNSGIASAIEVSELSYSVRFGHLTVPVIQLLKKELHELEAEDNYSRINLELELVRQLTLRGQWAQAKTRLENLYLIIYTNGNPRQEVIFELRSAELFYLRGEFTVALNHLRNSKMNQKNVADRAIDQHILGFEHKLLQALEFPQKDLKKVLQQIQKAHDSYPNVWNQRFLARIEMQPFPSGVRGGEDRVGDLLEASYQGDANQRVNLVKSGMYSFIAKHLRVKPGEEVMALNYLPNTHIVIGKEGVSVFTLSSRTLAMKLLLALASGRQTKKSLIEGIWGYAYEWERHDPMLYRMVQNVKKLLGDFAGWLSFTDNGYELNPEVRVFEVPTQSIEKKASRSELEAAIQNVEFPEELNHRQVQLLRNASKDEFFSTPGVAASFKVSEITANRDLRELVKLGYLKKIGQARATRYMKTN